MAFIFLLEKERLKKLQISNIPSFLSSALLLVLPPPIPFIYSCTESLQESLLVKYPRLVFPF